MHRSYAQFAASLPYVVEGSGAGEHVSSKCCPDQGTFLPSLFDTACIKIRYASGHEANRRVHIHFYMVLFISDHLWKGLLCGQCNLTRIPSLMQEARRASGKADTLSSINQDRVSGAVSAANKAALAARVAAVKATQRATISSLSSLSFSPLVQAGY
jgi:hypothetical protein